MGIEKEVLSVRLPKVIVDDARKRASETGTTVTRLILNGLIMQLMYVSQQQVDEARAELTKTEQERKAS